MKEIKHLDSSGNCCLTRPVDKYETKAPNEDFKNFDEVLNKFKKLNEYTDVRIRPWFKDESKANPGIYLSDYSKYSEILKNYKIEDNKLRKELMERLQKEIPILMQSKKFKKTIGYELENRMLLDPKVMMSARDELEKKSTFVYFREIDDFWEINNQLYRKCHPDFRHFFEIKIFAEMENNIVNKFIVSLCSENFNDKKIIRDIEKINDEATVVGECSIKSNQITFFDNHHFYTNDPKDYKEPILNCDNGNFKIKRYVDKQFEENEIKAKKLDEKSKKMKISREYWSGDPESEYYIEDLMYKMVHLYASEFHIKNKGNCFYFIDFK